MLHKGCKRDRDCGDFTRVPSLVRRSFYNIGDIIGNKGVLGKILGNKSYLPMTLNVSVKTKEQLTQDLQNIWNKHKFGKTNPVILKPSTGQEQRGIGVTTHVDQSVNHILDVLKQYPNYSDWEIQKYIYKPFSIKGEYLFPGLKSYSLGKLCVSLNIPIHDRHRATGDA